MLILFMRKVLIKENNDYMIILDKNGEILGGNEHLMKMYPNLGEMVGNKIYTLNKKLKQNINHYKYYELAVK